MITAGQRKEGVLQRYLDDLARNPQRQNHLELDNIEQNRKQRHPMNAQPFVASLPRASTNYLRCLEDESCPMCFHSYDMGTTPSSKSTRTVPHSEHHSGKTADGGLHRGRYISLSPWHFDQSYEPLMAALLSKERQPERSKTISRLH